MDENAVKVIVNEMIAKLKIQTEEEIRKILESKVSKEICEKNHKEVAEMKDEMKKIYVLFIAILTGIIVQIASALIN